MKQERRNQWLIRGGSHHALGHRNNGNLCGRNLSHSPGMVAGIALVALTLGRHLRRKCFAHRPQDRTADMLQHPFELFTMPYRERLNYMRGRRVFTESTRLEHSRYYRVRESTGLCGPTLAIRHASVKDGNCSTSMKWFRSVRCCMRNRCRVNADVIVHRMIARTSVPATPLLRSRPRE
jgi:hypothetical protein